VTLNKSVALLSLVTASAILGPSLSIPPLDSSLSAQQAATGRSVDWPLHNLDLAGSRFSSLDQIKASNVKSLSPRWLFQHGVIDGVSNQTTPVIVGGVMYVTDARGSVYALNAADGEHLWTFDVTNLLGGGRREGYIFRNRGVCYANGVIYTAGGSFLFALDAKTGKPLPGFGKDGQASVILDVLGERYPEVKTAISMGYWFTSAPQYHDGVIYIGSTRSESRIPGGHVLAVDAKTGKVLWYFNTIPQDERDQGWEIAGPTWTGGERNGGGIWETPSIDPELGLLYVAVANPFGDSAKRLGMEASKNGFLYILNRETGQPVHEIRETPVPTEVFRQGEQAWPTQPIPYTAAGKPMMPVSPVFPVDIPAERLAKCQVQVGPDVHAAGAAEPDSRAGYRRRRQLRTDFVQPADRVSLRQRD
jgi:glucose dehydrogenase